MDNVNNNNNNNSNNSSSNNNNTTEWKKSSSPSSCEVNDNTGNGTNSGTGTAGGDNGNASNNNNNDNNNNNKATQEKSNSSSNDSQNCSSSAAAAATTPGPDPNKLKAILDRTNYSHQVTAGQRKYGGPPPDWTGPTPSAGCEIFVGKIPKEIYEDELIPLFEKIGKLWDLRLMIDPITSQSRGYAFITYCNKEDAQKAVQELNGHKISPKGYSIKVNISVPNLRLFIGNIPKVMSKDSIFQEFNKVTEGLSEVIIYSSPDDRKKNRGFCFLEFDSHKNASAAKRKLTTTGIKIFKSDILVDWADPQEEPDEETMSKVKVLYVRNLTSDVTENQLKELFEQYGSVERVKKIKDYAFIHFNDREHALNAMENLVGKEFGGSPIEISLAKPPSDRRKKEEVLRNRERRMIFMMHQKQIMMAQNPRVPQSQLRLPIPAIYPLTAPMLPQTPTIRNGNHHQRGGNPRFSSAYLNPLLSVPINRQNPNWNPPMLYDPSDYWYNTNRAAVAASAAAAAAAAVNGPQFNFTNVPPNNQWNQNQWGGNSNLTNGGHQVPQIQSPFCTGAGGGPSGNNNNSRSNRNNNHHGANNSNTMNNSIAGVINQQQQHHNNNMMNSQNNASLFRKWRVSNTNNQNSSNNNNNSRSNPNSNKRQ